MFEFLILIFWKVFKPNYLPEIGSKWVFNCFDSRDPFFENSILYKVISVKGNYVKYMAVGGVGFSSSHVVHFRLNYKEVADV